MQPVEQRVIVLHINDLHGRLDGLARVATLVSQTRAANPDAPVLFFDLGDVEEPSQRLSNITKGSGMHRLLGRMGCDAVVAGNGAWFRYGPQILAEHAAVAPYPLLLANLRKSNGDLFDGVKATALLDAGGLRIGLIGLSARMRNTEAFFDIAALPVLPLVKQLAAELREQGAGAVLILSHLGLDADRELAAGLGDEVVAIIGGHSHSLLPDGDRVGDVWIAQAGNYGRHLGRIDLAYDGRRLTVTQVNVSEVTGEIKPAAAVLDEAKIIEREIERYLDEVIGELAEPLDYAVDRECGTVDLMADVLRERMQAEVGLVAAGQAFVGPLPAGPLRRGTLYDACNSSANPGITTLTGVQLQALVARGIDPEFAIERPHSLRGEARGLFHLSGASIRGGVLFVGERPVEPERKYRVAGSDWELASYGGYAPEEWNLDVHYDMPTILREAVEDYLRGRGPVSVVTGRLDGARAADRVVAPEEHP